MHSLLQSLFISILLIISSCCSLWTQDWSAPVNVSDPTFLANPTGLPSFAVDASGNAFAVWSSTESGQNVIRASRFDALTDIWSAPEQIGSASSQDVHVVATTDGKALAVWTNSNPTSTIYANIFDGAVWTGELIVDTDVNFQEQFYPRAAIDALGTAYLVWQVQGGNLARVIRSINYSFSTNTWTTVENISTDYGIGNQFVAAATVAANDSGMAVATWIYQDTTTPLHKVQSNRFAAGSWLASGSEETITTSNANTTQFAFPVVAVAPNGDAIALWVAYDATMSPTQPYVIMSSVRDALSSTWSAPIQVSLTGNCDISKVTIGVGCDGAGNAVADWLFQDQVTIPNVAYVQGTTFPGLVWSSIVTTLSDVTLTALLPSIAVDSAGDAYATWTSTDFSTFFVIDVAKYTKSTGLWDAPLTISDSGLVAVDQNQISGIASNAAGDFFAGWFRLNTSPFEIVLQSSHIAALIPSPHPQPPQAPSKFDGKIIKRHHYYHKPYILKTEWQASLSADVVYYQIYRKHHKVKKIYATSPLHFKKYIYSRSSARKYRIAAFNLANVRSEKKRLSIKHH